MYRKPEDVKYVIIAHSGGDGISSAAIAVNKLGDPIDLYFSQTYTINGLLRKIIKNHDPAKIRIYILDLHINEMTVKLLENVGFGKIVYISHHKSSKDMSGIFSGKIDIYKSAAQLSAEYFGALKSPLATLGTICDRMLIVPAEDTMLNEATMLQKSLACNIKDDLFRKYLVEQLSAGNFPSQLPEVRYRNKCTDNIINRLIKLANYNLLETPECAITYIEEDCKGFGRQVANRLIPDRKCPVFLLYPDTVRNKIIIIARKKSNKKSVINLSHFMQKYFSGGGHPNAAGGVIEGRDMDLSKQCPMKQQGVQMVNDNFKEYMQSLK